MRDFTFGNKVALGVVEKDIGHSIFYDEVHGVVWVIGSIHRVCIEV
jgi:hypothetical protein